MKKRKLTEVLIETVETVVIRRRLPAREPLTGWCAECACAMTLLTPDDAAALLGVSTRTLFRRAEAGQLHFQETPDGRLWLCRNAVMAAARENKGESP